jgi:hypothetical protein
MLFEATSFGNTFIYCDISFFFIKIDVFEVKQKVSIRIIHFMKIII